MATTDFVTGDGGLRTRLCEPQPPMVPFREVEHVLAAAIEYAREGRASHVAWAEHLAAGDCECCTPEVVNTAGDAAVQCEWVRKYDVILTALGFVEETLTVRLVDAVARISDEEERKHRVKNARHALRYREEARLVAA